MRALHEERFVFIDESFCKTGMCREFARGPRVSRVVGKRPSRSWKTVSLIGAILLGEKPKLMTHPGSVAGPTFLRFVRNRLVLWLRPGDLVVMDNLNNYKMLAVRSAIEAAGGTPIYLPTYSPELNPIELLWADLKRSLRTLTINNEDQLRRAVRRLRRRVPTTKIWLTTHPSPRLRIPATVSRSGRGDHDARQEEATCTLARRWWRRRSSRKRTGSRNSRGTSTRSGSSGRCGPRGRRRFGDGACPPSRWSGWSSGWGCSAASRFSGWWISSTSRCRIADGTAVAKSAISQARQRSPEEPLAYLFETTAAEWAMRSAEAHRWRGLTLYGMDGTTMRVPDSPENRLAFGGQRGRKGDSGYPQVRVVALMALRSHVLAAVRFSAYGTGETTLARAVWSEIPEDSLTIVDRNFLVKKDLIHLETSGNRHWLSRTKMNTRWAVTKKLGKDDYLVEWDVHATGLPGKWEIRAIHYKRKGFPRSTLLTSLADAEKYPAKELVALYHERWELELAYDEVKTHLLDREETIRSRTPTASGRSCWGIAIAYNLVRREMERVADSAGVPPTRISFVTALFYIRDELSRCAGGPRLRHRSHRASSSLKRT